MSHKARVIMKLAVFSMLISSLLFAKVPIAANLHLNSLFRELNKRIVIWYHSRGMEALAGEQFVVFYRDGQQQAADVVLEAAESFYPIVARNFGLEIAGPIPVVLYNSVEELNRRFGWPADTDTLGVYWAGSIRVLSPESWLIGEPDAGEGYYRDFAELGPMAHEIAHLFVDQLTRGNCPRWFNEGVAQYQEYLITGFRFGEARLFPLERAYTFAELAQFDHLEDQSLAYHQSFSIMYFWVEKYGWSSIIQIMDELGRGTSLDEALGQVPGMDLNTLDGEWKDWVAYR